MDGKVILQRIEQCGRVCYKSEDKITEGSAERFVAAIIRRGHESVLEHCSVTVKFTCDRGVSHEIVRHRLASFNQESTRYCNYSSEKFDNEITVIFPSYLAKYGDDNLAYEAWFHSCQVAEDCYFTMLSNGCTPQEARAVLPTSLKTELVMTANMREWRHFLKLRCDKAAHPQIRELSQKLLKLFQDRIPVIFDDIDGGLMPE